MKLNHLIKQQLLLWVGLLFCYSCTDSSNAPEKVNVEVQSNQKKQFPFYKYIELKPGYGFEIISWGKGVDSIGAYQILMSDSLRNNYKSISSDRRGIVQDAWNMDLDTDGNPELYIQLADQKGRLDLNVFEFSNGNFSKIGFPDLSANQKKYFVGKDNFYIKEGDLFRSFEYRDNEDSTKISSKILKFKLRGNSFSSSEEQPNP